MKHFLATALLLAIQPSRASIINIQFDPDEDRFSRYCDLPPRQDNGTLDHAFETCSSGKQPLSNMQESVEIQLLAERFAPYVFFHPLENFTMSSVNRTFDDPSRGRIIDFSGSEKDVFDEMLNQTSLMSTTRDPDLVLRSHEFMFEHHLDAEYKYGDGFDAEGISNAPIYYKAFDSGNNTITINYFMYYTWNGPLGMSLVSSYNGTNQYIPFQQPPWGEHEGDWESMSVVLCYNELVSLPLAVAYRQRSYGQTLDCTRGECIFYKNTFHPVGFAALDSHVMYPVTATELVWHDIANIEFFVNLQAVLLVDRLAYKDKDGRYRYFAPNGTANVLKLAEQNDIPDNVDESEFWGAFGGRWGRFLDDLPENYTLGVLPRCLDNRTTLEYVDCPTKEENPVFLMLMQMLGVNSTSNPLIKGARAVYDYLLQEYSSTEQAPTGPSVSTFYSHFEMPGNADIWKKLDREELNVLEYCARLADIPDTYRLPYEDDPLPIEQNFMGIGVLFFSFTIVGIFLGVIRKVRRMQPVIFCDETGQYMRPGRITRRWVFVYAWFYTAALLLTLAGAILFFTGLKKLAELVRSTFNLELLSDWVQTFIIFVESFNLVSQTYLWIVLWFLSQELWLTINRKYFHLINDGDGVEMYQWENRPVLKHFVQFRCLFGETAYTVLFSLLMIGLFLSVVMVAAGVYHVGFSYMFGSVCRRFVGSLDGKCFYYPGWDDDGVNCGRDFDDWCRDWAKYEMLATLWGAFLVVLGTYYLIIFSVTSFVNMRNINRTLLLYNEEGKETQQKAAEMLAAAEENDQDGVSGDHEKEKDEFLTDVKSSASSGSENKAMEESMENKAENKAMEEREENSSLRT